MTDRDTLRYIHRNIVAGLRSIYAEQYNVAFRRIYVHGSEKRTVHGKGRTVAGSTGRLRDALSSPAATVETGALGVHASFGYPTYIRFLDMKRYGNYKIYNRIIWGRLYGDTFPKISFEYREEVRNYIRTELRSIMNQLNNPDK